MTAPLKTFIIYASADRELRDEFERHLKPLVDLGWLSLWSDKEIAPGEQWDSTIKRNLHNADIFLMLVSVDFYNSGYIRAEELNTAISRLENGDSLIIPIIARHCSWKYFPVIKDLQVLPPDGIAVTDMEHWKTRDKAWSIVVERIGDRIETLRTGNKEKHNNHLSKVDTSKNKSSAVTRDTKHLEPFYTLKIHNGTVTRDFPQAPEMVFVEGGTFQMGDESEQPIHPVTLQDFHIGKYPVTFEEYDFFCEATHREKPKDEGWGRGKRPVINVNYEDALAYCAWLTQKTGNKYHLPSEAQWEFAARGGNISKRFKFAGSDVVEEVAWYCENSGDKILTGNWNLEKLNSNNCKTRPVGEKKSNELGIHDMSGNVWEWCNDWYNADYYKNSPTNAPDGPASGSRRVCRGGSWLSVPQGCRVAYRNSYSPGNRGDGIGFRLARTL